MRLATEKEIEEKIEAGLYFNKGFRTWLTNFETVPTGDDLAVDLGPYQSEGENPATEKEKSLIDEYDFQFSLKEIREGKHLEEPEEEIEVRNDESIENENKAWDPTNSKPSAPDVSPSNAELIGGAPKVEVVNNMIVGGWHNLGFNESYGDWLRRNPVPQVEGEPFLNEVEVMETPMVTAPANSKEYMAWKDKENYFLSSNNLRHNIKHKT